ncbi:MAG: hypothetical protein RMK30_06305 [Anaerolineae bacterium]|nr:hypothetical protein [Anaerolineae bacterium]MDW8102471.1 hypothetical protein [Anaerolineae bacterium]
MTFVTDTDGGFRYLYPQEECAHCPVADLLLLTVASERAKREGMDAEAPKLL